MSTRLTAVYLLMLVRFECTKYTLTIRETLTKQHSFGQLFCPSCVYQNQKFILELFFYYLVAEMCRILF